ncbi:hypothetical protein [Gottfriedia acidiceleris]|uniref:hypothetical protein n=1 Tax=Gottfriedia acidiceleris TaxID=371036 RepID=UPI002FFD8226
MKKFEIQELSIGSIRYVYDEKAATKWFDLYVEFLKNSLLTNTSKDCGQAYICYEGSDEDAQKSNSLLP